MARIELANVSLTFRVRPQGVTLKDLLVQRMLRRPARDILKVRALQDVTLHFGDGDRVGILGHNGAGKSTLLRLLAGVYPPSRGSVRIEGRISSLFEISLGFEADANGWENMAYRGYLHGETPATIRAKMHSIAEFSELGQFLDVPVRHYSSGMLLRLAFSIATAIEPEILLIDEILGVGDLAFQAKAQARIKAMMAKARLIVMVSHDLKSLAEFCSTAVWLDHGRVRGQGPVPEIAAAYQADVQGRNNSGVVGGHVLDTSLTAAS
jgi:lipopolysaccharide transport system ATP-binding protein